jgi:hypothetical protein
MLAPPVLTTAFVDYILMLNNYLQTTGEVHLLSWEFSQIGPEHQATHTAVAKRVSTYSPLGREGCLLNCS